MASGLSYFFDVIRDFWGIIIILEVKAMLKLQFCIAVSIVFCSKNSILFKIVERLASSRN